MASASGRRCRGRMRASSCASSTTRMWSTASSSATPPANHTGSMPKTPWRPHHRGIAHSGRASRRVADRLRGGRDPRRAGTRNRIRIHGRRLRLHARGKDPAAPAHSWEYPPGHCGTRARRARPRPSGGHLDAFPAPDGPGAAQRQGNLTTARVRPGTLDDAEAIAPSYNHYVTRTIVTFEG